MNNTRNNFKMYILRLIALFTAGKAVFASNTDFILWLVKKNYFFNEKAPIRFLFSNDGLRFIKDRVRAIRYSNGLII